MNKLKQQILSIEPKDKDYKSANEELDFNIKKYNFQERKHYAGMIYASIACAFVSILALILTSAILATKGIKFLDTSVLVSLIGLIGTIVGLLMVVIKYFFKEN